MCGCHKQSATSKGGCPRLTPCASVDSGGLSSTPSYNGPHPCPLPHSLSLWVTGLFFLKTNYYYTSEHPRASGGEDDIPCSAWKQCRGNGEAVLPLAMKWRLKINAQDTGFRHRKRGQQSLMGTPSPPHKHQMKERTIQTTQSCHLRT